MGSSRAPQRTPRPRSAAADALRDLAPVFQAVGLVLALVFVMMVTYLPHMQTLEGRINPTGAVENRSEENPYLRLGRAYGEWFDGEREDYPYPMHVDADVHWVRSAAIQRADDLRHPDPYTHEPHSGEVSLSLRGLIHEKGYHLAFATFAEMTGIPFILIIQWAPMVFAGLTAWIVWAALRPWPGAALAAALVALVPTSPRFLGIAFFVPIGQGLAWLAAGLLLAKYGIRDRRTLFLLFLVGTWAFFIHLIAGFAFLLVLLGAIPAAVKENKVDLFWLSILLLLPFLLFFNGFQTDFDHEVSVLEFLPIDFSIFDQIGIPFLFAWVLGCALLVVRPLPEGARIPISACAIGSAVALGIIVSNLAFDWRLYALYDRWHQPFALLAAPVVAYGIVMPFMLARTALLRWSSPGARWVRAPAGLRVAGVVGVFLTGALVMSPAVAAHLDEPYYYFMDDGAWARMQAAADLGPEYEVYFVHPWQAPIYNALTGKRPYTVLHPGEFPVNGEDYEDYYRNGRHLEPLWLAERGIEVVLDPLQPENGTYWIRVDGGYAVLRPAYAG